MANTKNDHPTVKDFDVNGYLSDIIHKDKLQYTSEPKTTKSKESAFNSDDVNNAVTQDNITV